MLDRAWTIFEFFMAVTIAVAGVALVAFLAYLVVGLLVGMVYSLFERRSAAAWNALRWTPDHDEDEDADHEGRS